MSEINNRYKMHDEAAREILRLIRENAISNIAVIAPNFNITHYVRDLVLDEAQKSCTAARASRGQWIITFPNLSVMSLYSILAPERLRGKRFNAFWYVAPQMWQFSNEHYFKQQLPTLWEQAATRYIIESEG